MEWKLLAMQDAVKRGPEAKHTEELLRRLLMAGQSTAQNGRLEALIENRGIDWDFFLQLADLERVAPLLFDAVNGMQIVPVEVEEALRESYLVNAKRNMFLLHELGLVLDYLKAAGIEAIVLKGAALAETVYPNVAVRIMRDIDILVYQEQARAALLAMADLGYDHDAETMPGSGLVYENEVALYKAASESYYMELHWSLYNSPFYQELSLDWYWETAEERKTTSGTMHILSPEAQILYYSGHIQLHHAHEAQMLWMIDLKKVIELNGKRLDWPLIVSKARENYLVLSLRQTLAELRADWQVPIPDGILRGLQEMEASEKESAIFVALTAEERPVAQRFWTDLKMMPSWRRRLHYAWINLFPSRAYMCERYGFSSAAQLPLYYIYRFYLGLRSGLGTWRR